MSDQDRLLIQTPHYDKLTVSSEQQIYHCPITNCPQVICLPDDG